MKHLFVFLCLLGALGNVLAALFFAGKYILFAAGFMWAGNRMATLYMKEKGITDEDFMGK